MDAVYRQKSLVKKASYLFSFLLMLLYTFGTTSAQQNPGVQRMPSFVQGHTVTLRMPGTPPKDYFYLIQQVKAASQSARDEYFRRWQEFVAETVDCDSDDKLWWFISLASMTSNSWMKAENAAVLEGLILEDPACALRGMQGLMGPVSLFVDSYLFNPTHHEFDALDAALRTVLDQHEFAVFATEYRRHYERREARIATQRANREAREARERKAYWNKLRDGLFYGSSYDEYLKRWAEFVPLASCDDEDHLRLFFDTAMRYSSDERLRHIASGKVADLAVHHPDCVLRMLEMKYRSAQFIDPYLLETPRADEIYHALFDEKEQFVRGWREYIQRVYSSYLSGVDHGIDIEILPIEPRHYKSFGDGRVYLPMPSRYSPELYEELRQLWQSTPDGEIRDGMGQPIKLLALSELAFIRRESHHSYYLLQISDSGVSFIPAQVVGAALSYWNCDGPLPLLIVEPESYPGWLTPGGQYPVHGVALGLPDDLAIPEVEKLRWPDNYIYHGRFYWDESEQGYDFSYTYAYVDLEFSLVDSSKLMPYFVYGFPSCH